MTAGALSGSMGCVMPKILDQDPPLVKGGQTRSADEILGSAASISVLFTVTALALLFACGVFS